MKPIIENSYCNPAKAKIFSLSTKRTLAAVFTLLLVACSDHGDAPAMFSEAEPTMPEPVLRPLQELLSIALGELNGRIVADGAIAHYQGIPYAAAPTGDGRWRAPAPAPGWVATLDATAPGPACLQGDTSSTDLQSEDCLFLNVAAPAAQPAAPLAVMVWFHGGGDDNGSGHEGIYNIAGLAEATGNVVVSVNARLGFLGFMAAAELRLENADGSTGNYHHLDQVMALQWIQDNIADFNGDPSRVTIFGESAGGNDVCRHLSSRLSDGLFQGAILQSSTCGPSILQPLAEREQQGEFFKQTWGCATAAEPLACMRAQDAVDLRASLDTAGKSGDLLGGDIIDQEQFRPAAAIDNVVFTASPQTAMQGGSSVVDVVVGVNLNEFTLFLLADGNNNPDNNLISYQQVVRDTLEGVSESDITTLTTSLYPCANYDSCSDAFADLMGDAVFACPSLQTANTLTANGNSVHFYEFTQPINGAVLIAATIDVLDVNAPDLGVPHSAELFYLWDLPVLQSGSDPQSTVNNMQAYWGSFARDGDPVADGAAAWPLYSSENGEYLELGEETALRTGFKRAQCDFIIDRQLGQQ